MKKIKKLCVLAVLLMLLTSCSRIVHTDYELVDYGTIVSIDKKEQRITIHSALNNKQISWFVTNCEFDYLSKRGLGYTKKLVYHDKVNIYQNGKEFFATTLDVRDAQNINKALTTYYWQHLAENWDGILIALIIIFIILYIINYTCNISRALWVMVFIWGITLLTSFSLGNIGAVFTPSSEGKITKITPTYVTLNDKYVCPYATLEDISTHVPVKVGQQVNTYSYNIDESSIKSPIFFSTHKLNENTLKSYQSYPENLLMTSILIIVAIILENILFFIYESLSDIKKTAKTTKQN